MKLLRQRWGPLLDWQLEESTAWSPGWARSSVGFPRSTGWKAPGPLWPHLRLRPGPTEEQLSHESTKHYSLANWTVLAPDGCSQNLFSNKSLPGFNRWCSAHAESHANAHLEVNKSIPSLLLKFEKNADLFSTSDDSLQYLALLLFLKHVVLQNTDKSLMSPLHQGWKHLGSLLGCRRKCSEAFVTSQMRQCWDSQNTSLLTN